MEINFSHDLYHDIIEQLGGVQFDKGLFTIFKKHDLPKWEKIVCDTYSTFTGKFRLFGYDWLGRCFGVDLRENTKGNILMFEIGTADVLEIPCDLEEFLNQEIPLYSEACLAKTFFEEWSLYSNIQLGYGKCAGYIIPLFLNGEDKKENLEESDMEVYWEILRQLIT